MSEYEYKYWCGNCQKTLINWDDFNPNSYAQLISEWQITNVKCPKCGERLHKNTTVILPTNPPKHQYKCFKCDFVGSK